MVGSLNDLDTRLLVDLLRDRSKPDKSLGQHFLVDEGAICRTLQISEEYGSPLSENSHVLEVGPGPGSLTLALLKEGARVTALEIDEQSVLHLRRVFGDRECELVVKMEDALSEIWPPGISHVISNLPYQISSPILERIRKYHHSDPIQMCVLLVQEEFAHRMAMTSPPYDVGPLGLNLWLDFEVFVDRRVPPNSFAPAPRVNSRLVALRPINRTEADGINRQMFRIITRHCFSNRRRKMRTLLSSHPSRISRVSGWHKARWKSSVSRLLESGATGLAEGWADLRPENLSPEEWVTITRRISSE
tara:strand:- start:4631 stop:5542 length:912 start_codon:yes stop_codon:yes gene_type:complete